MLLYILYAVVALIVIALGVAATRPGSFRIERSTRVGVTPDRVAAHINDFHRWAAWSPWEQLDPQLERSFSGAPSGKGAIYEWRGNKKVGSGRMEITDITPAATTIKLDFIAPFEAHNIAEFQMLPEGSGTQVTWAMHGASPFVMRVFGLFFNMDKTVGGDFERGLANLKQVSEAAPTS